MKKTLLILTMMLFSFSSFAANYPHSLQSFSKSKKLMKKVYADHQVSFYCDCNYSYQIVSGKQKTIPDWSSCGYTPRKQAKRGSRIEWEHVIPAENFGRQFSCWREGNPKCITKKGKAYKGRRCCNKVNQKYKIMQADLHNLQPAVGELNGDRSNYRYGLIPSVADQYGACNFKVDFKAKRAEPKPDIRGNIARTYFYFQKVYGMKISKQEIKMLKAWDKQDPVDVWEIERNKRIEKVQGNANSFIVLNH